MEKTYKTNGDVLSGVLTAALLALSLYIIYEASTSQSMGVFF